MSNFKLLFPYEVAREVQQAHVRDAPVDHVLFLLLHVSFVLQTLHLHLQRKGILDNLWQHTELISTRTI